MKGVLLVTYTKSRGVEGEKIERERLTQSSNDLRLKAQLVLETAGNVADTSVATHGNIGHLADMVEHVAAGEDQDGNKADGGPQVAALQHGQHVRPRDHKQGDGTGDQGDVGSPQSVVDGALDGRVGTTRQVVGNPTVNGFGGLRAMGPC